MQEARHHQQESTPQDPQPSQRMRFLHVACGLLVLVVSYAGFAFQHYQEVPFADEYSYLVQTFYLDLFQTGQWDSPAWNSFPAIDQPPLQKYLGALALKASGRKTLGNLTQAEAWHKDFNLTFGTVDDLMAARRANPVMGALGCLAVYGIGLMLRGPCTGLLAAALLALNPLYYLDSRQLINDVTCAALLWWTCLFALKAWKRLWEGTLTWPHALLATLATGIGIGLTTLAKLTGVFLIGILGTWIALAWALAPISWPRKLAMAAGLLLATLIASAVFVALNPSMTSRPQVPLHEEWNIYKQMSIPERFLHQFHTRQKVSGIQQLSYPDYALLTLADRLPVLIVQGFGRFGPLGPRYSLNLKRFDWSQDWGATLWLPCVLAGVVWAFTQGRRQYQANRPPLAWALLAMASVQTVGVLITLKLAWDRYLLPLQPIATLLAAAALLALLGQIKRLLVRPRLSDPVL